MSNQVVDCLIEVLFIFSVPLYCLKRRINVVNTQKENSSTSIQKCDLLYGKCNVSRDTLILQK